MIRKDSFAQGFNWALGVGILLLLALFVWWVLQSVFSIWMPFIAAILLALLLDPIVDRIQRHGTRGKRGPAVIIVFLAFLAIFVGLLVYLIPTAISQMSRLVRFFSPVTYKIEQAVGDEEAFMLVQDGLGGNAFVVRGLRNDATYRFRVTGQDVGGGAFVLPIVEATPKFGMPFRSAISTEQSAFPGEIIPTNPLRNPLTAPSSTPTPTGQAVVTEYIPSGSAPLPTPPRKGSLTAIPEDGRVELTWSPPASSRSEFEKWQAQLDSWLQDHRKLGPFTLPANVSSLQRQYSRQLSDALQNFSGRAASLIASSLGTLINIILVPLIMGYLLMDIDRIRARLLFLLPERMRAEIIRIAGDTGEVFGGYIRGMALVSAIYGIVTGIAFFALGMTFGKGLGGYALLAGVLAVFLYPIPYIGAFINLLIAGGVALVTKHTGFEIVVIVATVAVVNALFDNFVVPKVVGDSVGLNPLLTMFVLLLGGTMFGLLGMLFAVPLAGSIQAVLMRRFPKLARPTPVTLYRVGKERKESDSLNDQGDESLLPSEDARQTLQQKRESENAAPVSMSAREE
jgi:predicted PurR-regulated permease PerM